MKEKQFNSPQTGLPNVKLCPSCGFPNKDTDTKCCYCETPVNQPASLPPGQWVKWFFSHLKWKWKLKRPSAKGSGTLGAVFTFIAGLALCLAGVAIFTFAIFAKSFSKCILSLVFLLYGFFTLKNLFKRS